MPRQSNPFIDTVRRRIAAWRDLDVITQQLPNVRVGGTPPDAGASDHGTLTGLADDDHSQYHNDARGDARYYTESEMDTALAGKSSTSHNHDADYADIAHDHDADYAALTHAHAISDTTGLQTALDGKHPVPSGTPTGSKFLRDDNTWQTVPGGSEAFPVGSIFIGVVSTNPNTLLGYGTWAATGAGRVMVGLDSGDADFDTAEETGGAKTKAISAHAGTAVDDHAAHTHSVTSNVSVNDHASHTHTYTQVPNHVHVQRLPSTQAGNFASGTRDTSSGGTGGSPATVADTVSTSDPTGGVATGTTAGPGATMTHTANNPAVTSANPSATLTHAVTQPNAHSDLNVVQPYFVVYMWKRTA